MKYSPYINDDPEILGLDWEQEQLRCQIEKARKRAICSIMKKMAELNLKLAELHRDDFIERELMRRF